MIAKNLFETYSRLYLPLKDFSLSLEMTDVVQ